MPTPMMTMAITASHVPDATFSRVSSQNPTSITIVPLTTPPLYRPNLVRARPVSTLETTQPSISGISTTPEFVADVPITRCMNTGMYTIAPNMPAPSTSAAASPTDTMDSRNIPIGSAGSGARSSCQTNRTAPTTPARASPMMTGDPHGYVVPPHTATSSRHTTNAVIRATP